MHRAVRDTIALNDSVRLGFKDRHCPMLRNEHVTVIDLDSGPA